MNAVQSKQGIIAIKEKHKDAIECLNHVIDKDKVRIALLPDMYPMGEERAVIRETLGILLDVNQLPSEAGSIVINVETSYRIAEAVELKKPVISKDITVGGRINDSHETVLFDVPLGTTVETILEEMGGIPEDYGEIIIGGPFTGKSGNLKTPIIKTSGGIILTMPFLQDNREMGLLVCACGANKERLEEIAEKMGSKVIGIEYCKQAVDVRGNLKCQNPGKCPGQSQKVMKLKKEGA
jgi:proline reductase-associated electron transfer protein PrdC